MSRSTVPRTAEETQKPRSGSVVELNNDNYKDIIADSNKDVVVEFYDQEVLLIMDLI